jgi:hypothetical protein
MEGEIKPRGKGWIDSIEMQNSFRITKEIKCFFISEQEEQKGRHLKPQKIRMLAQEQKVENLVLVKEDITNWLQLLLGLCLKTGGVRELVGGSL